MRALVVLGISFSLGVASLGAAENSREIRWRSGPSKLTAGTAELDRQDRAGKRHVVMQFDAPLSLLDGGKGKPRWKFAPVNPVVNNARHDKPDCIEVLPELP